MTRKKSSTDTWAQRTANVELGIRDLHDYQWLGTHALVECGQVPNAQGMLLLADMGLGKTGMVLTALYHLFRRDLTLGGKVLIAGPGKVMRNTWPEEFQKWEQGCVFTYSLVDGTPEERKAALAVDRDIYLISYDQIAWLGGYYGPRWPFRRVVIDEISGFKDHSTNRFNTLKKVGNIIKSTWGLTASPATEGYEGLFAQTYLVDKGHRLGKDVTKFRDAYFIENRYTHQRKLKPGADEEILEKIHDVSLVMREEDYLPRDKPVIQDWHVDLSPKVLAKYQDMAEKQCIQLDGDVEISADSASQVWLKLTQMASGFIYDGYVEYDEDLDKPIKLRDTHELHDEKLKMLLDKLAELPADESVAIAYWFKPTLARLLKALGRKAMALDKEGKAKKLWDAGKLKYFLIHPASGGRGLNLQKAGRRLIFYDIPASLDLYLQMIGRFSRQGQMRTVFVHHLIANGTEDERSTDRLKAKEDVQEAFYRRLKRMQAKRRRQLERMAAHSMQYLEEDAL